MISSGYPQRLQVRFTVSRFGRVKPVYLHYVSPRSIVGR